MLVFSTLQWVLHPCSFLLTKCLTFIVVVVFVKNNGSELSGRESSLVN